MGNVGFILNISIVLSGLVYVVESLSLEMNVHCAQRRAISPCTCQYQQLTNKSTILISVTCERMINFQQVITALQSKFDTNVDISLTISHSVLDDLPQLSFQQLGLRIQQLKLQFDNLSDLPESVFSGLSRTEAFSLAYNAITSVPQQGLNLMPNIKVLDFRNAKILNVTTEAFHGLNFMHTLLLSNNNISLLETDCLPSSLGYLHIGSNQIKDLNGTLRGLSYLQWLYLKGNQLVNLDGELPQLNPNTRMLLLDATCNLITKLPQELKFYLTLEYFHFGFNHITSFEGALSRSKHLKVLNFTHNKISRLNENDFADLEYLEELHLDYNNIATLNNSLLPLISLRKLNLSYNQIQEFSLQQLRGLTKLEFVDLSHNKINKLSGRMQNSVQPVTKIDKLWLQFNELQVLNGSLMGLTGLHTLNLSHNIIERISPDDLIGLDDLEILDISHNHIITLEETSKAVLPKLEELKAAHNLLTHLEKDFHGLPNLCWADLSYNRIESISDALGKFTQCIVHSVHKPLRIYLQGNLEVCRLTELLGNLQAHNKTEFYTPSNEACTAYLAKQPQVAVLSPVNIA
ncbi:leucine-rich repeat-containing larval translucida [Rhodnius prolixus]|uniref:leucine-rich repeat-containing larval translucida n=1 Tax=Rhodnius prolixus TaxID=13249 RepID=UPI003D18D1EA